MKFYRLSSFFLAAGFLISQVSLVAQSRSTPRLEDRITAVRTRGWCAGEIVILWRNLNSTRVQPLRTFAWIG
jgi:hypothetical protein